MRYLFVRRTEIGPMVCISLVALDRLSFYTVKSVLKLAWVDLKVVVIRSWSSLKGGRFSRFDCMQYILQ